MARFSPRINGEVTGWIIDTEGEERPVVLKNIGLGGFYCEPACRLSPTQAALGSICTVRASLEKIGELTVNGSIVRRERGGFGLRFSGITRGDLLKIWTYIREFLLGGNDCPYCNHSNNFSSGECGSCGWKLDFENRDYFLYFERESLFRQLTDSLSTLSINDLRKISGYAEERFFGKRGLTGIEETEEFLGNCQAMKEVFSLIRKVAPTDLSVLILGESGTGKELVAHAIHERSVRENRPFVAISCAAIPESLLEAELFGFEKGAFTGAYVPRKGRVEDADGGTLFLDEIGELPVNLQPKLLRFLETQKVERVGSTKSVQVDVRIITATNCDLEKAAAEGRFRSDLFHRIKVFSIKLPPLRERGEDKILLAQYFLKKIKSERNWRCKGFTPEALDVIREYAWPGNVREMINRVRRAVVVQDESITPDDLEFTLSPKTRRTSKLREADLNLKKEMIESTLNECRQNISQTARALGISRPYLHVLIKKLGIYTPEKGKV